jgi:beta-glucosidase
LITENETLANLDNMRVTADETSPLLVLGIQDENRRNPNRRVLTCAFAVISVILVCVAKRFTPRRVRGWGRVQTGRIAETTTLSAAESFFPDNFIWGAATSAYQIEGATNNGGRGISIWDKWCDDPNNCAGDTADIACDHFHRIKEDVSLMKDMGLQAYRFSISWPRIFPMGNDHRPNHGGIQFYNMLIDELVASGITPWVTLYHWDLPQNLEDHYGGWLDPQIVDDFARYASTCFEFFGDRVKHWITINEAWTVAIHGYDQGLKAPGHTSSTEPYLVGHHLLLAHARAVKIYRGEYEAQGGMIGISNCGDYRYPLDAHNEADITAANRAMEWQLAWFTDPIFGDGIYPKSMKAILGERLPIFTEAERREVMGSADFFGLNHYSSALTSEPDTKAEISGEYWADQRVDYSSDPSWKTNCMGWSVVPEGGRKLLYWINDRYVNPQIIITENGSCEDEPSLASSQNDTGRRDYLEGYIRAFGEAIQQDGVKLKGYFVWSLMDNFEWSYGMKNRFGIVRVNFDTLERHPKLSARWYNETIRSNGRNIRVRR